MLLPQVKGHFTRGSVRSPQALFHQGTNQTFPEPISGKKSENPKEQLYLICIWLNYLC